MPVIPGIEDLGGRPNLQTSRPIVENRSGQIKAQAITDAGEAAIRTGQAVKTARDDFNFQIARSKLLELDLKVAREVQELPDYTIWDKEYQSRMAKGKTEIIQSLRNPQHQAIFDEESNLTITRGSGAMYADAFKREADDGRASLESRLLANREMYLTAKTPAQRAEILANSNSLIAGAAAQQYISNEDAVKLRETAGQDYASAYIGMLDDNEQIKILKNPKGTPAEILTSDARKTMLDQANARTEEERLLADAYAAGENFDPTLSYAENKKRVVGGARGKNRRAREAELGSLWQERNIAAGDTYQALHDRIEQGTFDYKRDVLGDPDVLALLSASEQNALKEQAIQKSSGEPPRDNPQLYWALMTLKKEDLAKVLPWQYKGQISEANFKTLESTVMELLAGNDAEYVRAATLNQKMTQAAGPNYLNTDEGRLFAHLVENELNSLPPEARTPDAEDQAVAKWRTKVYLDDYSPILNTITFGLYGTSDETAERYQLQPGEKFTLRSDSVPIEWRADVIELLRQDGVAEPTETQIIERYKELIGMDDGQ